MRYPSGVAAGIVFSAAVLLAQSSVPTAPKVAFEVASVKVAEPLASQVASGKLHVGMQVDGRRVDIGSLSLADLLPIAFKVKPYQISGPAWMTEQRFDLVAKIPAGATPEQVPEMLQAFLAERFQLAFHRESRDNLVYALVVGKSGSKLKEAAASGVDDKEGISVPTGDGSPPRITREETGMVVIGAKTGTTRIVPSSDGSMHMEASSMTMEALADALSRFVDRPVVDMTGLKGAWQVSLDLSVSDLMKATRTMPPDPGASSIFSSVQRLGLRLEPRKVPVETIVIDHLEKFPTEN